MRNLDNALREEEVIESEKSLTTANEMSMPILHITNATNEKLGNEEEQAKKTKENYNKYIESLFHINMQAKAREIADIIEDELHKFWKNKNLIKSKLYEISSENALSFARYMITISKSGTIIEDCYKYITYNEIKHLTLCLLLQAKNNGLVHIAQYKRLIKIYNLIREKWNRNPNRKIDKKTLKNINFYLEELYEELTKHNF